MSGSLQLSLAVALVALTSCGGTSEPPPTAVPAGCSTDIGTKVPVEGQTHVAEGTPVTYQHNPPSSGNHWPSPLPYSVFRTEQPRERWVHSLEHGAVVLLYNCPSGCDDVRDQLEQLRAKTPVDQTGAIRVVVTPDSKITHKIAAVAWTWVLELDAYDEEQLKCFIAAHKGQAPEDL